LRKPLAAGPTRAGCFPHPCSRQLTAQELKQWGPKNFKKHSRIGQSARGFAPHSLFGTVFDKAVLGRRNKQLIKEALAKKIDAEQAAHQALALWKR